MSCLTRETPKHLEQIYAILTLRAKGWGYQQICAALRISPATLSRREQIAEEQGIQLPPEKPCDD